MFGIKRTPPFGSPDWYEMQSRASLRDFRKTGDPEHEALSRLYKLQAEAARRGLNYVTELPADVLRKYDHEGAQKILGAA